MKGLKKMKERTVFNFDGNVQVICHTGSYGQGMGQFAEVYQNDEKIGKTVYSYFNRTWECFTYQSVLLQVSKKFFDGALNEEIQAIEDGKRDALNNWLDGLKKDYDGLHDNTKKHLANALKDHEITSMEEAESIMKISKAFDFLMNC